MIEIVGESLYLEDNIIEKYTYDEKSGLWYEKQGDYYFSFLGLPKKGNKPIGIGGQLHARYLKHHHKVIYYNYLTSGNLNSYLADTNAQAEDMFSRLVKQLAEKENVTEKLKAENQMLWVQRMNSIHARALEVINAELIYT